ncbi:HD domain-containing phosphohydrolase [Kosmotoga olearia]|uniref:PAS/PAC sensor protein n=1 Tax=Kosmotoga olearia (strain ATCC BAA-1733 / DSM 21960 / TBF 19.5.1) TaxID=521045 RepID=C5CIH3_KOSOT|nr:HD-GYP domain-containing protein [Kosmotoga olearia]ACR79836.1 putative PAS/PAC sensor protein [Kosmotoga olearia TBF 19.5.1]
MCSSYSRIQGFFYFYSIYFILPKKTRKIIYANPAAERLFEGRKLIDSTFDYAISNERIQEFVLNLPNNRKKIVQMNAEKVFLGNEEAFVITLVNVTKEKMELKQLTKIKERLDLALEGTEAGIWDLDLKTNEVFLDERFAVLFGWDNAGTISGSAIGKFFAIVHPEDVRRTKEMLENHLKGLSDKYEVEARLYTKSGEWKWAFISGKVVEWDENGKPVRMVGTVRDITENKKVHFELQETLRGAIRVLGKIVEKKDPYTAGHQHRVSILANKIAKELNLPEDRVTAVAMAGLVHDIGKISIPSEILVKPGSLTPIEWQIIKSHPEAGYEILKEIKFPWPIADIVLQHHERMDGSGYPKGLKNGEILLEARILAVADVVEAMSSHRPYRPALGIDNALEEIDKNAGKLYDPDVVQACLKIFKEGFSFNRK